MSPALLETATAEPWQSTRATRLDVPTRAILTENAAAPSISTSTRTAPPGKSARKTRSWEKAEEKAQDIRESFDPAKQFQRELEAKTPTHSGGTEITQATDEFMKEIERLNREEATRKKYKLTLARLSIWCAAQSPPVFLMSQLDVPTLRQWVLSWPGAPTTRHNQHQCLIAFFYFCIGQGWIKENPAKRIKNVPAEQLVTAYVRYQQSMQSA